ncbi:MAG TPA: hypothetical protein PLB01_00330 [Thermoanaerobaculia bacterium]|nr:hypothetical protein [Thermoanaerobaculia bacterium]
MAYRGMDGDPVGIPPTEVEAAARLNSLPWPGPGVVRFRIIKARWFAYMVEQLKKRNAEAAARAKAPPVPEPRARRRR